MSGDSSREKFIARNRAPRVQIEYDVELYGSEKKVQLPFVMGVVSDLAGKSKLEQPAIEDRKFLEIDVDNFDERMKAMAPRVAFAVPNTLTGEGNLPVDLTFEGMKDFSPGAIAAKVDVLRPLLEARTQLTNLMAYMDGKAGAETLIEKILADPSLLSAISATGTDAGNHDTALDSLCALARDHEPVEDNTPEVLDALRAQSPQVQPEMDSSGDVLDALRTEATENTPEPDQSADILDAMRTKTSDEVPPVDGSADVLDGIRSQAPESEVQEDPEAGVLETLRVGTPEDTPKPDEAAGILDSMRSELPVENPEEDQTGGILSDLATAAPEDTAATDDAATALDSLADIDLPDDTGDTTGDDTDDLLADLATAAPEDIAATDDAATALDSLADIDLPDDTGDTTGDDTDDLLGDLVTSEVEADGLDDLLGDLDADDGGADTLDDILAPDNDTGDGLDDLLGDLEADSGTDALDDLLGDLTSADSDGDPADIPGERDAGETDAAPESATLTDVPEIAYGTLSGDRPDPQRLNRNRFRLAILGDFSGRAARGLMETGDALATRKPILLDPDTVEDVIEGFATDLVLPIGRDGAGMVVKLKGLDDLHPDELYEKLDLFSELVGLRGALSSGATAENAAQRLRDWGATFGTPVAAPRSRSSGNAVPANLRLSDFQKLIGDTTGALVQASPIDDLLARVVGPHIRAIPDADTQAMQAAVDQALSAAMRMVLHHPEFQSVEAQWRSIDLIARSIETDDTLDVMLYDVSAEEIAADLASANDLSQSGLARLLTDEPLDTENGRGGYSALIGLYSFEETPPHADLLGRIGRVAAHVDAPFIAAISPAFLDTAKQDRHPLVAQAWDTLRSMPEAGHLGLASPRFLLRRPYGAKTEPIYEFEFEEFTRSEGLNGMLWANPVVLVAILLAKSFRQNGKGMNLGSVMSLGEMPYHFVIDSYGDQVALPCTERNLTLDKVEIAMARGFMPVASIKGRDEIRLTSFQSLAGGDILGPWTDAARPLPSPAKPAPADDAVPTGADSNDDLDDLLAGFDDELDLGGGDDDIDADLAALLDDL